MFGREGQEAQNSRFGDVPLEVVCELNVLLGLTSQRQGLQSALPLRLCIDTRRNDISICQSCVTLT